jgi:hypothetical protein
MSIGGSAYAGRSQPVPYKFGSSSNERFLCLGGRLRLSAITLVPAGARPDSRALRRATCPTSNTFFFRFFMLALLIRLQSAFCDFGYGAISLIDGFVGVCEGACVGIGDVDVAEGLAADFAG